MVYAPVATKQRDIGVRRLLCHCQQLGKVKVSIAVSKLDYISLIFIEH